MRKEIISIAESIGKEDIEMSEKRKIRRKICRLKTCSPYEAIATADYVSAIVRRNC